MSETPRSSDGPRERQLVSTTQVAEALGLSVTTVKRWVDDGILPAHRTPGGHRRLLIGDVVRLVRSGALPHADLSRLLPCASVEASRADALSEQLQAAIHAVDPDAVRAILLTGSRAGTPIETLADEVIGPAMALLGHEWEANRTSVQAEHRITQACVSALYELRGATQFPAGAGRPVAVGGAPEHDHYVLPSLLAELTLVAAGWQAVNIGPHSPVEAFASAMEELSPRLVWLSVSHVADPGGFPHECRRLAAVCESRGVPLVVGGGGVTADLKSSLPGVTFGRGMADLAAAAKRLNQPAELPKRGRPPGRT